MFEIPRRRAPASRPRFLSGAKDARQTVCRSVILRDRERKARGRKAGPTGRKGRKNKEKGRRWEEKGGRKEGKKEGRRRAVACD